ncbi:metalloregulator ArsR/SmtB family transcription factor [Haloechinothrix sp. LS1_15]|uniref:ArsR/SmtB family transcription factor n=1 Tax=Haloechinothrix sp. LS1_15 TaxID=2652248 RepID=UPI00294B3092|nr:metalloregulator ArsR/SmtB family transcription factor [Haloechinothrix sp. LS1_15]
MTVDEAVDVAAAFKALSDPVRVRLLSMIAAAQAEEGVCVCELTPAFAVSQQTISHHLKQLRQARLIDCERRGTWVYYWLVPGTIERLTAVLGRTIADRASSAA